MFFRYLIGFWLLLALWGCNLPKGVHDDEPDYAPMVAPNFKAIQKWIFETRCVECHGPNRKEKGIDLSSYEKIFDSDIFPPLIVAGHPEKSSLFESIVKGRMPKGYRPLKKKEIDAIYEWIQNGAKKSEDPNSDGRNDPEEPREPDEPGKSQEPVENGKSKGNERPTEFQEPG